MSWVAAILVVAGFLTLLRALKVPAAVASVFEQIGEARADLRDRELDDHERERRVQRHAIQLLKSGLIIAVCSAVAIAIPLAVLWLADRLGWVTAVDVWAVLSAWPFWIAATVLGLAVLGWPRREPVGEGG